MTATHHFSVTLSKEGRWKDAVNIDKAVVGIRERVLGESHPDTIHKARTLALTYSKQGQWKNGGQDNGDESEGVGRGAFGHPRCYRQLAVTYSKKGRWRKAEELEVKVIVSRRMVGEEHEDTLDVTGNLAATHREQGRLKEADDLHVKVIDASRRVLDAEHPGHNQGDR